MRTRSMIEVFSLSSAPPPCAAYVFCAKADLFRIEYAVPVCTNDAHALFPFPIAVSMAMVYAVGPSRRSTEFLPGKLLVVRAYVACDHFEHPLQNRVPGADAIHHC